MRRALPTVFALAALALAGCSNTAPPAPAAAPITVAPTTQAPAGFGASTPTERGALPKALGQHAGLTDDSTGAVIADFAVTAIAPASCNAGASKPQNGRFLALTIEATTKSDPNNVLANMQSFGSPWEFVAADGRSTQADNSAAAMCHYDAPVLKPNRSYTSTVVVDVPAGTAGVLVFDPARNGGWEWSIAA
ncbi:MAG: hypothetical protein OJJ54_17865 [Pseudonocardia sp.]|nr:hypothetical protein [Pseudonocardia sp.]